MNEPWNQEFLECLLPLRHETKQYDIYLWKIPKEVTIETLKATPLKMGGLEQFITKDFQNSQQDQKRVDSIFMIQLEDGNYQVFLFERLLKNWVKTFSKLEDAFEYWMQLELNSFGHSSTGDKGDSRK